MAETIISKYCPKCKTTKPVSEFHKSRTIPSGVQGWCKLCRNAHNRIYSQAKQAQIIHRKANRRYCRSMHGKASLEKYAQTERGIIAKRKGSANMRLRKPEVIQAINAVNHAVTAGKIPHVNTLRCTDCPKQADQYHHYKGYEKEHWLDIVPLCLKCHNAVHLKAATRRQKLFVQRQISLDTVS